MRKHIPHPVTRLTSPFAELDILYGGNEADAMEESMKIARDLRDVLQDGEKILYVNTLVSLRRMGHVMGKRFDHGARRDRNNFVTYCSGELIDKLPVIRYMTEQRNYKYLVINGFELAALNSRHRAKFMGWLRVMRNEGVNVILFTMSQPGHFGALGALRYSARSVEEVGAYLKNSSDELCESYEGIENEVEEVLTGFEEEVASEEGLRIQEGCIVEADLDETEFADDADATKVYAEIPEPTDPEPYDQQHSDEESLKTKDLALECV
jgi:hypothetical protein